MYTCADGTGVTAAAGDGPGRVVPRYTIYLLCWYKRTNTETRDAGRYARATRAPVGKTRKQPVEEYLRY